MPLAKNDIPLISSLREYRVMTVKQVAAISCRSCQVIRRRIRSLENKGLIIKKPFGYGQKQGRPEEIIYLSQKGIMLTRDNGIDPKKDSYRARLKDHHIDHELLANWFYIHWLHMKKIIHGLFFSCLPPRAYLKNSSNQQRFSVGDDSRRNDTKMIIPDGILSIRQPESNKALLFFLEVDMDSESLTSKKWIKNNIHNKIICYQEFYRSMRYKILEEVFNSRFNGFRLLFLANNDIRVAALCRFLRTIPGSDFIWLTDQSQIFDHGVAANIWIRGGQYEKPRESILGKSFALEYSLMESIR